MKISHESPKCLMNMSRLYNDYDYALVHLFENDKEYYDFFKKSLKMGRRVILDNSIFELGKSFNINKYVKWIKKLKPTDYIIPDEFNDYEKTIEMFYNWIKLYYGNLLGEPIAVVHGKNINEIISCYKIYDNYNVKIAFNFADHIYKEMGIGENNDIKIADGRIKLIDTLLNMNIINLNKKHHLLGCTIPIEFSHYIGMEWIESIDTSNPIIHAINNKKYNSFGLSSKDKIKLVDLINTPIEKINFNLLYNNLKIFKRLCGR